MGPTERKTWRVPPPPSLSRHGVEFAVLLEDLPEPEGHAAWRVCRAAISRSESDPSDDPFPDGAGGGLEPSSGHSRSVQTRPHVQALNRLDAIAWRRRALPAAVQPGRR